MKATISAVILTKNEENTIVDCISSVSWCDEIIVIDDMSSDNTVALAKQQKATVYQHSLQENFSAQRNFGIEQATGEWVLFIDADERITLPLHYEILSTITNGLQPYSGYMIKRVDTMWGKKLLHGEMGNTRLLRLAKKSAGKWKGLVHEKWIITGKIGAFNNTLEHLPHPTVRAFLQEVNHYTDLRSLELFEKKVKATSFSIIAYPTAKFLVNYFLKKGFQDGIPGLINALMMSFHSFLVRGKLWLLWSKSTQQNLS
ncbi:glycosyltransferase family 2 protein [soil metagenome]